MLDAELMSRVRQIRLRSRRAVTEVFAGEYASAFKGRGMEFSEVREYEPGDDVRSIDWNVTARQGSPYVKRYVEERELTLLPVVDVSGSAAFGTGTLTKRETAAELASVLATAALMSNDRVGLLTFDDGVRSSVRAGKGQRHVMRVLRELLRDPRGEEAVERAALRGRLFGRGVRGGGTDPGPALEAVMRHHLRRSVVVLVSDFLFPDCVMASCERALRTVRRRHDLVLVRVSDARERRLPSVGLVELVDAETGGRVVVDTGSARVRRRVESDAARHAARVRGLAVSCRADLLEVETGRGYLRELVELFRSRERRRAV